MAQKTVCGPGNLLFPFNKTVYPHASRRPQTLLRGPHPGVLSRHPHRLASRVGGTALRNPGHGLRRPLWCGHWRLCPSSRHARMSRLHFEFFALWASVPEVSVTAPPARVLYLALLKKPVSGDNCVCEAIASRGVANSELNFFVPFAFVT